MIYRVVVSGVDIYGDTVDTTILSPSVSQELNAAGSFEFILPPDHAFYNSVAFLKSDVEVYEDGNLIFFGRPSEISIDWNNQKRVYCEGAYAYFNDSVLRPSEWDSILISDFYKHVLAQHNAQVPENRQIKAGNITILDKYVYRKLSYETTIDALTSMCIDTEGGYFFLRKDEDGVIFMDWLADMPSSSSQPIQFGVNLLDLSQDLSADNICTAVIPLGMNFSRAAKVNEATAYMSIYESMSTSSDVVGRVEQGKEVTFDFVMGSEEWYKISNPYNGYALAQYLEIESGDVPLTIAHINGGVDIIESEAGIAEYGRITKTQQWTSIKRASELKEKGEKWLADEQYDHLSIECDAAELHYFDGSYTALELGQNVRVISTPHLLDKELPITKITINLDSGSKKVTIGTIPHKTLTEIVKNG